MTLFQIEHWEKYRNFTWFAGVEILRDRDFFPERVK